MDVLRMLLAVLALLAGIAALVQGVVVGPLWAWLLVMALGFCWPTGYGRATVRWRAAGSTCWNCWLSCR